MNVNICKLLGLVSYMHCTLVLHSKLTQRKEKTLLCNGLNKCFFDEKGTQESFFSVLTQLNVDSSMILTLPYTSKILICNSSDSPAHWCKITQRAKSCWVPNNKIPFSQEHYLNSCATTSVSLSIKQMGWYGAAGILKAVKHCWWLSQAQTQDIRTAIFHPAPQALQAHASSQQWHPAESTVPQIKGLH